MRDRSGKVDDNLPEDADSYNCLDACTEKEAKKRSYGSLEGRKRILLSPIHL
jgi:hypothetical protein